MRGEPTLSRLPYFKIYRSRQEEVYRQLCTARCSAHLAAVVWARRSLPGPPISACGRGPADDPSYTIDDSLDDDHGALDCFPLILLAAGYKGVCVRGDSPGMTDLGRLKCFVNLPRVLVNDPEEAVAMRPVTGSLGQPLSSEVIRTPRTTLPAGGPVLRSHALPGLALLGCSCRSPQSGSCWSRSARALPRRRRRSSCCARA